MEGTTASQIEKVLTNLARIEQGLAKIYDFLSKRKGFSKPVQKFWETIKIEEMRHAAYFNEMLDKVREDSSYVQSTQIDPNELQEFVQKVNASLESIKRTNLTEAEAYSFAAHIEADLDEAHFAEKIHVEDSVMRTKLQTMNNETKKHSAIMINHARGIK